MHPYFEYEVYDNQRSIIYHPRTLEHRLLGLRMDGKQKEKKTMTREEAIRILASSCISGSKQTEALETLIPELAESEDERIRRKMIEHFKAKTKETWCNMPVKDILAYLEKQKEQKPAESISQLTVQGKGVYKICPRCKERMVRDDSKVYTSMPAQYGYECPKCGEMEFDTVMYDSPVDDKQKEQKQEWSEDSIIFKEGFKTGRETGLRDGQKYVLDNLESYGLCKPAEWSEEDEIMLKWIEDILLIADDDLNDKLNGKVSPITDSAYSSMKLCIAKCLSWLKSFKSSWKPSEVCYGPKGDPDPAGVWKPSEEQMEALKDAVKLYKETHFERFHDRIVSLYEQLKKLM